MGKIILGVLTLTELIAIIAVYKAFFGAGAASFVSTPNSLTIIALAVNTAVWTKYGQMHCSGTCSTSK